tara:strand:- start:61 stop:255 length:195 start_codon:yes stop_codon:yes gene_type:complete
MIIFEVITGTANEPISIGLIISEYFPNIEENNPGKIIVSNVMNVKRIVRIPIDFEIVDMKKLYK